MNSRAYKLFKKSPQPKKILRISGFILLIFFIFLAFVPWQQFALGNGRVIAFSPTERQFVVNAPMNARIHQWHVIEGMQVKAGDPIVTLNDNDPQYLSRLELEKKAVELRIQAAKEALTAGEYNLKRQKKLYEEGINSRRQYELSQIEYAQYKNTLAQANIDKINIEVRIARQKRQEVTAHMPGYIFRRLTGEKNVYVHSGQMLAMIVPDTPSRAVELWVSGRDIPFVRLNQIARLQFDGWPAIQFHGWPEIAVGTFAGRVTFIDATDNGLGQFRVVISPTEKWPNQVFLRQGVKVHGWVQLGRVPIWFELWRQFNGFPPKSSPI